MKPQKPKVYVDNNGDLVLLNDRVPANAHDRVYLFEMVDPRGNAIQAETITSPGKLGFKCLGPL